MTTDFSDAQDLISSAQRIAVVSHLRPDGDAVGSILALTCSLAAAGKTAIPVLLDGIPETLDFLPGAEKVCQTIPSDPDLIICVDCADVERSGLPESVFARYAVLNIDHHPTNTSFGSVNYVVPQAAAAVEIVYDMFMQLEMPINESVRTNLMVGLLTDTIGFRTSNVHPGTLRMAADLLQAGGDLCGLYDRVLNKRSFTSAKYWGFGLQSIQKRGRIVWASLSLSDRSAAGYPGEDDADLINFLSTIEGALVTILFIEQSGGTIKVSWRARDGADVAQLARKFGGGGHKPAAGAMIQGVLNDVEDEVLTETFAYIEAISD